MFSRINSALDSVTLRQWGMACAACLACVVCAQGLIIGLVVRYNVLPLVEMSRVWGQ